VVPPRPPPIPADVSGSPSGLGAVYRHLGNPGVSTVEYGRKAI